MVAQRVDAGWYTAQVSRLPGGLADSALEHAELMAEGKHLGAELGIGAGADEHEVTNEADELVGEAEKHVGGSCPIAPTVRGRDGALSPRAFRPPIELTPHGLRHR